MVGQEIGKAGDDDSVEITLGVRLFHVRVQLVLAYDGFRACLRQFLFQFPGLEHRAARHHDRSRLVRTDLTYGVLGAVLQIQGDSIAFVQPLAG